MYNLHVLIVHHHNHGSKKNHWTAVLAFNCELSSEASAWRDASEPQALGGSVHELGTCAVHSARFFEGEAKGPPRTGEPVAARTTRPVGGPLLSKPRAPHRLTHGLAR